MNNKKQAAKEARARSERERQGLILTRFICHACRAANREHRTHPGVQHLPGICDCPCRH